MVRKLKHVAKLVSRKTKSKARPYVGLENVESWTGKLTGIYANDVEGDSKDFEAGHVLFGKLRPYLAKAILADFAGRCTSEFLILEATNLHPQFLLFTTLSEGFVKTVDSSTFGAKMPRAEWSFIGNMKIPIPPYSEQQSIAGFLNKKMQVIEKIIERSHKLASLLQEKRLAIISQAVTQGISSSVSMKDSGLPWLGKIPAHWKLTKLKFACTINPKKIEIANFPSNYRVSFLPMEKIGEDGKLILDDTRPLREISNGFTYFRDNDVIVAKITPCFENGKGSLCANLTNGIGFGTTELHVLRPHKVFDNKFIFYWTRSHPFLKIGESMMQGSAGQKRVPPDFIQNFTIAYPESLEEQQSIVQFVEDKTHTIDFLLERISRRIDKLQQYRRSLISATITGKVDVREEEVACQ